MLSYVIVASVDNQLLTQSVLVNNNTDCNITYVKYLLLELV
jgi:hypothetical protein